MEHCVVSLSFLEQWSYLAGQGLAVSTQQTSVLSSPAKVEIATFAYDRAMLLIKDSFGRDWAIDGLAIMPLNLNSWLLTGFIAAHVQTHSQPCAKHETVSRDRRSL